MLIYRIEKKQNLSEGSNYNNIYIFQTPKLYFKSYKSINNMYMIVVKVVITSLLILFSNSTILITQPAVTGFADNQINYWFANFGNVHYNKAMSFALMTTNETMCGKQEENSIKPFTNPTYLVVKQGGCSFTKKAIQAQSLGAQGIIIGSGQVDYSDGNVVLSDDGNGRKVRITVLFVKPEDVNQLSTLLNPKVKVNFELSQRNISNVDIFLSASGKQNYIFLRDFRPYYNKMSSSINLNIAYHTIQCKGCLQTQCILQNNCCTFDLDSYSSGKGRYIIYEQFRQYKIFKYFSNLGKIDQWFEYMDRFDKKCSLNWIVSQDCSAKIQEDLGIKDLPIINQFDTMMDWRRMQIKTGIISLPDISVNGIRHVQQLNAETAFDMICESLSQQIAACSSQPVDKNPGKGGIIAAIVISCIVFILAGIFCYRKIIRRQITNDMSSKVDELVARYASKVSEQKKKRKDKLMERMTEQL